MSSLFVPASPTLAKTVKFIDTVLCTWVHNPVLAAAAVLVLAATATVRLVLAGQAADVPPYTVAALALDFVHNAVNMLFIVRFPSTSKGGVLIVSNTPAEVALFVVLNIGTLALLFCPVGLLFYSDMHVVLKLFLLWQILSPYFILAVWALEVAVAKKEPLEKTQLHSVRSFLVETNNTFLPIFIAHSFAAINFDVPFAQPLWLAFAYKCACYSFKFYLIHCFILYELAVVIGEHQDLKSYSELYAPVSLDTKRKTCYDVTASHTRTLLLVVTGTLMTLDMGWMFAASFA